MRIVFMGTPDFSVGTLEAVVAAGHEVACVVTQPDKPRGRGKELQPTPVKEAAQRHGLPVYQPAKIRDPEAVEKIRSFQPDVIVVVAFGQIIPQQILDIPRYGCINVHASLLPKYRGAAPIQWAIIDGEEVSGVTIMRMDAGLDTGDMISKVEIPLEKDETAGTLFDKLSDAGAKLLVQTLPTLEDQSAVYEKQPELSPTPYSRMISKKDGEIDWSSPAVNIERLIRGMSPWPSAYTHLGGKTLKIWRAETAEGKAGSAPGTVLEVGKGGLVVSTGDGALRLLEIQLEGKKRMDAEAFLRGFAIEAGTILGSEKR